ncbi:MAG: hypothetical protein FD138_3038 [Planctomycetota bacterium]|nr:MAG: hypothetical protein FD138_3038 [Planctomycetota bacterium]
MDLTGNDRARADRTAGETAITFRQMSLKRSVAVPVARTKSKSLFEEEVEIPFDSEITERNVVLDTIDELNSEYDDRYRDKFVREERLSRSLVSFQANKERPFWSDAFVKECRHCGGEPEKFFFGELLANPCRKAVAWKLELRQRDGKLLNFCVDAIF